MKFYLIVLIKILLPVVIKTVQFIIMTSTMNFKRFGNLSTITIVSIAMLFLIINSCKHDGMPAEQMQQIFYADVEPIFISCAECHNGDGDKGGYDFTTYDKIMNTGGVVKGNASKSKAYQAMTSTFQVMPPKNPLTTGQRTLIWAWIEQGANNTPAK